MENNSKDNLLQFKAPPSCHDSTVSTLMLLTATHDSHFLQHPWFSCGSLRCMEFHLSSGLHVIFWSTFKRTTCSHSPLLPACFSSFIQKLLLRQQISVISHASVTVPFFQDSFIGDAYWCKPDSCPSVCWRNKKALWKSLSFNACSQKKQTHLSRMHSLASSTSRWCKSDLIY